MMFNAPTAYAWTILIACAIIIAASVFALVSKLYDDTMTECVGLAMTALAGVILIMQVYAYGFPLSSGVAFMCVAGAVMAVALMIKRSRQVFRRRGQHHRNFHH